jgi:hydroxymethylglutaryl-CoA lyase
MASIPTKVQINEEGPREGFQIEKGNIPTARKIELIDSLSQTGLNRIQIVSFVNPKAVPGMADAEEVVEGFNKKPGISYVGLWLNDKGLKRAIDSGRLEVRGSVSLCASGPFLKRNQNRTMEENIPMQHKTMEMFRQYNVPVTRGAVMAAFGCNFAGDIPVSTVLSLIGHAKEIAGAHDYKLETVTLADTMAWATPASIKRVVGAVQEKYPELEVMLHLHDTRGMGIANAYAGLEMGVNTFDAAVAGLGGCPFAGHAGAAGNVCTEDLVFMCDEMGIETGINLEALMESARLAEEIVGHPLPGSVMRGGSLRALREQVAAARAA